MSLLHLTQDVVHSAAHLLADPVPNPGPVDPTGGSKGVSLLLSYVKWGALSVCGAVAMASGGLMAIGKLSHRPDSVDKGKGAFIWAVGGVVVVAIAIPLVNNVFNAAS
jgi:hypothetical protein